MGRYKYIDHSDWFECEWCCERGTWLGRPCLRRANRFYSTIRSKRQECELVRMENAARRDTTLPKVYRRVMAAAAAQAEDSEEPDWSVRTDSEGSVVDGEVGELDGRTPVEVDGETGTGMETEMGTGRGTGTEKVEVSPLRAGSGSTSKLKHHDHEVGAEKTSQRQAKSCSGPRGVIDEGVDLASDDGDVARIHAANRKAWPRGQEPIAADATAEDREIAELVRRGLIGAEGLRVDHGGFGGDVSPLYTVRFVEARKKGRKGMNRWRQGVQVAEASSLDAESDWWYLDDEAYARLLSDGGTELVDWSEASSFVHVE